MTSTGILTQKCDNSTTTIWTQPVCCSSISYNMFSPVFCPLQRKAAAHSSSESLSPPNPRRGRLRAPALVAQPVRGFSLACCSRRRASYSVPAQSAWECSASRASLQQAQAAPWHCRLAHFLRTGSECWGGHAMLFNLVLWLNAIF